jgi:hypothetical protein
VSGWAPCSAGLPAGSSGIRQNWLHVRRQNVTTGVGEPRRRRQRFFSKTLELGDQDASCPGQLGRRRRFLFFAFGAELFASEIWDGFEKSTVRLMKRHAYLKTVETRVPPAARVLAYMHRGVRTSEPWFAPWFVDWLRGGPTESTKLDWSFAIDPVLTPDWSSDDWVVLKCLLLPDWSLGFGPGNTYQENCNFGKIRLG